MKEKSVKGKGSNKNLIEYNHTKDGKIQMTKAGKLVKGKEINKAKAE